MKRNRIPRFAAVTVAALLAAGTAACGSSGTTGGGAEPIKIGVIAPLTGQQQSIASAVDAMKAFYEEQVNSKGGINGHKIEVVVKDDGFDPAKTPAQARALVESEQVNMMCGTIGTPPLSSVYQYFAAKGMPNMALSGEPAFAGPETTTFEHLPPFKPLGASVFSYALDDLKVSKIAVAFSNNNVGIPFKDGVQAEAKRRGLPEVPAVEFNPTAANQSTTAAQLAATGADVVLISYPAATVTLIAKAANQIGFRPVWASTYSMNDIRLPELSQGLLNNATINTPFLLGSEPSAQPYRDAMKKHLPAANPLSPILIQGWTTADVCAAVLTKAVAAAGGAVPSTKQILDVMRNFELTDDYVRNLKWTPQDHSGQKSTQVIKFDNPGYSVVRDFADMPQVAASTS
jgi:branched-chain amino acid transport system substrate-binding protein